MNTTPHPPLILESTDYRSLMGSRREVQSLSIGKPVGQSIRAALPHIGKWMHACDT